MAKKRLYIHGGAHLLGYGWVLCHATRISPIGYARNHITAFLSRILSASSPLPFPLRPFIPLYSFLPEIFTFLLSFVSLSPLSFVTNRFWGHFQLSAARDKIVHKIYTFVILYQTHTLERLCVRVWV